MKQRNVVVQRGDVGLWLGLTAVVLGYFLTWLPHASVGLTLIGLDISEWAKFLPQMQSGQLPNRNFFYLPPITAGLLLALFTAGWPNQRWETWLARATAVGITLLALPSLEAVRFEPASEWQLRVGLIGLVGVVALGTAVVKNRWPQLIFVACLLTAVAGAILPLYAYLQLRLVVAALLGEPVGIGLGVWLNTAGHILILSLLLQNKPTKK